MSQMIIEFFDETQVVPSFKLPYWSVKRFYGLFEAHGLYFKSKLKRKHEMRSAVSSLGVVYKERVDTLDEISRISNFVEYAEHQNVLAEQSHLNKLKAHVVALEALEQHLNRFGVATEHEIIVQ